MKKEKLKFSSTARLKTNTNTALTTKTCKCGGKNASNLIYCCECGAYL